jgi:hypothetical protein
LVQMFMIGLLERISTTKIQEVVITE